MLVLLSGRRQLEGQRVSKEGNDELREVENTLLEKIEEKHANIGVEDECLGQGVHPLRADIDTGIKSCDQILTAKVDSQDGKELVSSLTDDHLRVRYCE